MAKKPPKKTPKYNPAPEEIVAEWRKAIKRSLRPWFLERKCFTKLEPRLRRNIKQLQISRQFTPADKRNSLRVARDLARICRILQPRPFEKKVRFDTFQSVLKVAARFHKSCQGGRGAGGWCDI